MTLTSLPSSNAVIGKGMERCVYKHIHNYLLENNIIINNLSGFTKGDSAIYQLICMSIAMSFKKIIKYSGPRIDHWGTPALMKPQSDDTLLITTLCFLPDR
jgi:hypothetical protein